LVEATGVGLGGAGGTAPDSSLSWEFPGKGSAVGVGLGETSGTFVRPILPVFWTNSRSPRFTFRSPLSITLL
jgi:hypothetical protein